MRNKVIIATVFFAILSGSLIEAATPPFVMKKGNRKAVYDKITADSRGVLLVQKGKIKTKINPKDYIYAHIPMPSDVKSAFTELKKKNYVSAADKLKNMYSKYKYLGWGDFCIYMAGQGYDIAGKKSDAIDVLERLMEPPADPQSLAHYYGAKKILAKLYVETGKYDKAKRVIRELSGANNDEIAAACNNLLGDILLKEGKTKDAKLMYMRTALLYDSKNRKERPEALVKIIKILKSEKNNKALEFKKILETDYPGSKYLQSLQK